MEPEIDRLWNYSEPAESEQRFRAALERAVAGDTQRALELLTQMARAQGLQGRFDEADRTLDEVEARRDEASARVRIRLLLERGRVRRSSGRPEEAKPLFLRAWEEAVAAGEDCLAVDAAHMLGIVEPSAEGMAWNRRALDLAEASADPRVREWRGALLNNMAWTLHDDGDFAGALELFERALRFRLDQGLPEPVRIARWSVARCLRSLERVEEAFALQKELLAEGQAAGRTDPYVLEEMGECLLALGQAEEARPWLGRAYAELSQDAWLRASDPGRLDRLKRLGEGG